MKKLFSLENLKKVIAMVSFSQSNLNKADYLYLKSVMDMTTINEEIEIKKAA